MSNSQDGGPAFPTPVYVLDCTGMSPEEAKRAAEVLHAQPRGMTLRQWYGGQAMKGLLANVKVTEAIDRVRKGRVLKGRSLSDSQILAQMAFDAADAMIRHEQAK